MILDYIYVRMMKILQIKYLSAIKNQRFFFGAELIQHKKTSQRNAEIKFQF